MYSSGNISLQNHIIHFILGMLAFKYYFITPIFLIYQLYDGFPLLYKVTRTGSKTDDIPMDLLFFSLGEIFSRIIYYLFDN
jgi:hypothetical protein